MIPIEPPFLVIAPAARPIKPPIIIDYNITGLLSFNQKTGFCVHKISFD